MKKTGMGNKDIFRKKSVVKNLAGLGQKDKESSHKNGKLFSARIPIDLLREMKVLVAQNDLTIQTFVIEALTDKVKKMSSK